MEYSYDSYYNTDPVSTGLASGIGMLCLLLILALVILVIVGMWKLFEKAGKPGWGAIVPFYNTYLWYEIGGYNGWYFLLSLIPFVGGIIAFVFTILIDINLAKKFGKSGGFAVGLIFLPSIFYMILGFDKSTYNGVSYDYQNSYNPNNYQSTNGFNPNGQYMNNGNYYNQPMNNTNTIYNQPMNSVNPNSINDTSTVINSTASTNTMENNLNKTNNLDTNTSNVNPSVMPSDNKAVNPSVMPSDNKVINPTNLNNSDEGKLSSNNSDNGFDPMGSSNNDLK